MMRPIWLLAGICLLPAAAAAQQPQQQPQPQQPQPQQPQPQQAPQQQQSNTWSQLPRMQLERQFAGPLQDTIIQRWRDPADGTICYIYLPITAQHSPPGPAGFVQYGGNIIGSISCLAPHSAAPHTAHSPPAKKTAPRGGSPANP
jgi:hypothetical protein